MILISLSRVQKVQTSSTCSFIVLSRLLRRYSTAVEETSSDTEVKKVKKNRFVRNIPLLLLPHTVKKAYHVHETSTTIPKIFDKYKWLTKTLPTPTLPSHYYSKPTEDEGKYNELLKDFHDSLFHTVAYVKGYKNKVNTKSIGERVNFSMMPNILRLAASFGEDALHLQQGNSYLYHKPLLETHWTRNNKFYHTKFRPTNVLRTKKGLEVLEEPEDIPPKQVKHLPGPYDPYVMNMYRQPIIHLRNQPGMDNYKLNPIKHCHTTIMQRNIIRRDDIFFSLGVMTLFAQLAAQAQADGVLHGMELEKPLVSQCIMTTGHQFVFMVYQLNTLCMRHDYGVWNRCWYSPVMEMFTRQKRSRPSVLYQDADTGDELSGFNEECFRLFVNFIRKETV